MRRSPGLGLGLLALLGLGGLGAVLVWSLMSSGTPGSAAPPGETAPVATARNAHGVEVRPAPPAAGEAAAQRVLVPRAEDGVAAAADPATSARGELLVVELDGVTPRPGYSLAVLFVGPAAPEAATDVVALYRTTLETDENGRAHCAEALEKAPQAQAVRFFSALELGLGVEPCELPVSELSADPRSPTLLRLAPRALRPVRALVVDAETGEPAARIALRVQRWIELPDADATPESQFAGGYLVATRFYDGADCEWVVSDAGGRFTTARGYPTGRIGFLTIDQERADLHHDAAAEPAEVVLRVPLGPLIRLGFAPGAGRLAEDYVAGIWRAPAELIVSDPIQEHSSPWSADGGARAGYWGNAVPVQVGDGPYLRPSIDQLSEPLPSFVYLLSRDGASFGYAPLKSFTSHRDEPLRVDLTEGLALRCAVVWPEEIGQHANIDMLLESLDAPGVRPRESYASRMYGEAETPFVFPVLQPGNYRVRVTGEDIEELRQDVRVPHEGLLLLRPLPVAHEQLHEFTVRVRTASGAPLDGEDGRAHLRGVYLWSTEGVSQSYRTAPLAWSGGSATLHYTGLRAGPYKAQVGWALGAYSVDGLAQEFDVPGPQGELRVLDGADFFRVQVRVIDPPSTGALIVGASDARASHTNRRFQFGTDGVRSTLPDGRPCVTFRTGPLGVEFRCNVWLGSEEHRHVRLEDEDIPPPDADGVRRVEIHSKPGWAARISVWVVGGEDPEAREPLPGVVLTLDDVAQLPTDAGGELDLSLDQTPQRIGVATPGWKLVTRTSWDDWGSVFADTGAFTVENGNLDVFLQRTDG